MADCAKMISGLVPMQPHHGIVLLFGFCVKCCQSSFAFLRADSDLDGWWCNQLGLFRLSLPNSDSLIAFVRYCVKSTQVACDYYHKTVFTVIKHTLPCICAITHSIILLSRGIKGNFRACRLHKLWIWAALGSFRPGANLSAWRSD